MEDILLYNKTIKSSFNNYELTFIEKFHNELDKIYQKGDFVIVDEKIYNLYKKNIDSTKCKDYLIILEATENQKSTFISTNY